MTKLRKILIILAIILWCLVAFVGSEFLTTLIFTYLPIPIISQPVLTTIYSALSYALAIFLILVLPYLLLKKLKPTRALLGLSGLPTWIDLVAAPVSLIIYLLISSLITTIFNLLPFFNPNETQLTGFESALTTPDRILAFITIVIIAPIAEELIFRGWLYGHLKKRLPLWAAIIIVSIIFGFLHGQWNVAVDVAALSVVLCILRELTGNIYAGTLLHMLKNGIAFFLLFIVL